MGGREGGGGGERNVGERDSDGALKWSVRGTEMDVTHRSQLQADANSVTTLRKQHGV